MKFLSKRNREEPCGPSHFSTPCDKAGGGYSGYAVALAEQIADVSEFGETLVSLTVKDLVVGSGIVFIDRGVRSFERGR